MGTAITLSLNGVDIDWGKNRSWRNHYWLFPPGSLVEARSSYDGDPAEVRSCFQTTLGEAHFRLCHLGYSQQETRLKFETAVLRWNRTADLRLSFADFCRTLTSIDFGSLSVADLEPFVYDFRAFMVNLLAEWDTESALLEDFIFEHLDFNLTLRVLADRVDNWDLPLCWHHQDLLDSGWASLETLTDLDRQACIINHSVLVGRLQDYADIFSIKALDKWLVDQGLSRTQLYTQMRHDGTTTREMITLPTAVRNMIHHPENPHNVLLDEDIRQSIELLLTVVRRLPSALPGLS